MWTKRGWLAGRSSFVTGEILICLACAGLAKAWVGSSQWDDVYIPDPTGFGVDDFIIRACTYFLLIANIIPISLYVGFLVLLVVVVVAFSGSRL